VAVQLKAILKHEIAYVQHRDNLTGLIQRAVEVLFWGGLRRRNSESLRDLSEITSAVSNLNVPILKAQYRSDLNLIRSLFVNPVLGPRPNLRPHICIRRNHDDRASPHRRKQSGRRRRMPPMAC